MPLMLAEIEIFSPPASGSPSENLAAFVQFAKCELTVFGSVDWAAKRWDISETIQRKGRKTKVWVNFTDIDSKKGQNAWKTNNALQEPFSDFAKAYLRYDYGVNPKSNIDGAPLMALRVLERTLATHRGHVRIDLLDAEIMNLAASAARKKWPASAQWVGTALARIAGFVCEKSMCEKPFKWVNPNRADPDKSLSRVGPEADARRRRYLPTQWALNAVARAFFVAERDRDLLVSSVCGILVCAPDRVSEVLDMRLSAQVHMSLDGKPGFGLRWFPAKGGEPMVKPIPATMVDVATTAFARLLKVSESARSMVRWYEENPRKLYLPAEFAHLRSEEYIYTEDARLLMGLAPGTHVFDTFGMPFETIKSADGRSAHLRARARFEDFERYIIGTLPSNFPVMDLPSGLLYSEAVCIVPYRFFKEGNPSLVMFERVTWDHIHREIGSGSSNGQSTLFTRLELTESDGSPIRLKSHQFRHWLNTIAKKGGLGEDDIALWSGRKNKRQNANYDHVTATEMVELVRRDERGGMFGRMGEFMVRAPITRDEFGALRVPTGHATEYGVCVHDYTMSPCQKHRDCINCQEQACVKGDKEKTARIRRALEITEELHRKSIEAVGDNWQGAGRWEEHHYRTLKRLRNLVAILDDDSVLEGSVIRLLGPDEYSPQRMALDDYRALTHEERESKVQEIRFYLKSGDDAADRHAPGAIE